MTSTFTHALPDCSHRQSRTKISFYHYEYKQCAPKYSIMVISPDITPLVGQGEEYFPRPSLQW